MNFTKAQQDFIDTILDCIYSNEKLSAFAQSPKSGTTTALRYIDEYITIVKNPKQMLFTNPFLTEKGKDMIRKNPDYIIYEDIISHK